MAELEPNATCVVCCHDTEFWALGECDHPTCLLCCARLRVLCDQKDCPVCRLTLNQVAVVSELKPFNSLPVKRWRHFDKKYDLYFPNKALYAEFYAMTENYCKLCNHIPPFRNFSKLQEHVNKTHQLHFCDICVKNLKLFPWEFKLYTRQRLTTHRRTGDPEDSSYKGHPWCEFCDERFLDKDALHLHLRKRHFWCHFCESDGRQDFYANVHFLRAHFKKDHYLCEEGDCYHDVLTSAFRNEIDLKAHFTSVHSKGLSKAEMKKVRNLPVEFFVNNVAEDDLLANRRRAVPVGRGAGGGSGSRGGGHQSGQAVKIREREERQLAAAMSASLHEPPKGTNAAKRPFPGRKKVLCAQDPDPPAPGPPPGFGVVKKHKDNEVVGGSGVGGGSGGGGGGGSGGGGGGGGSDGGKVKDKVQSGAVAAKGAVVRAPPKVMEQNWPSLIHGHSDVTAAMETAAVVTGRKHANKGATDHAAESTSPPPVTPPPGYAKIIRPTEPPSSAATKLSKEPGGVSASSSKAYPPLSSDPTADAAGSTSSVKSSGGSKVFEDIRKALDYDKEKFKDFQSLSGLFRSGRMTLIDYNTRCKELFGLRWSEIGPLVAKVMPQGEKRDELQDLFSGWATGGISSAKKKKKSGKTKKALSAPSAWTGGSGDVEEQQKWEKQGGRRPSKPGRSSHIVSEDEYPSLSTASKLPQPPKSNNAWNLPVHIN